jgi:DNA-binding response OmpR family regulator
MTRILVVDDEPDLLRFVRRALEAEGYQVQTATDGAEGLRLALTTEPDLIVLDLLMPGVDGQAVLSAVLAHDP